MTQATETNINTCCGSDESCETATRDQRVRFTPAVDIIEAADEFRLIADVPGVRAEDVDIAYKNGRLTLRAAVRERPEAPNRRLLRREYAVGDFHRSFTVGEGIDTQKIDATVADGVLTVRLPKARAAKLHRVPVRSAE